MEFITKSKDTLRITAQDVEGKSFNQVLDIIYSKIQANKTELDLANEEFTKLEQKIDELEQKIANLWNK